MDCDNLIRSKISVSTTLLEIRAEPLPLMTSVGDDTAKI